MKVVSVNPDGTYLVNVLNRTEFQEFCHKMIKTCLADARTASSYGFGYKGITFGTHVDFTQYCNFKKIPLAELPKVVNSIKSIIRKEIQDYIEQEGIYLLPKYRKIDVQLIEGVCCGMAIRKFNDDGKLVRDYAQQWENINAEMYSGKKYTDKQFAALKERKNQIYRKRQVMFMNIKVVFTKEDKKDNKES